MDGSNQPNSKSVSHVRNRKRQKIVTQFARDETSDPYQTSRNESAGLKIPKKKNMKNVKKTECRPFDVAPLSA